jgi:hypothetical protein
MSPVIELIGIAALPTAIGYALFNSVRLARWAAGKRPVERYITRPVPAEPIERLAARLSRLHAELEELENRSDLPVKGIRRRAVRGAYLDLLRIACEIYRVEAGLRERGLDVRAAATR